MRMRYNVFCDLPGSRIFFQIILYTAWFSVEKNVIEREICVLISSTNLPEIFLILRKIQ